MAAIWDWNWARPSAHWARACSRLCNKAWLRSKAAVGPGVGSIRPQGVVVIEGTAGPAPACLGY